MQRSSPFRYPFRRYYFVTAPAKFVPAIIAHPPCPLASAAPKAALGVCQKQEWPLRSAPMPNEISKRAPAAEGGSDEGPLGGLQIKSPKSRAEEKAARF